MTVQEFKEFLLQFIQWEIDTVLIPRVRHTPFFLKNINEQIMFLCSLQ
jgi:hypothetical protein